MRAFWPTLCNVHIPAVLINFPAFRSRNTTSVSVRDSGMHRASAALRGLEAKGNKGEKSRSEMLKTWDRGFPPDIKSFETGKIFDVRIFLPSLFLLLEKPMFDHKISKQL